MSVEGMAGDEGSLVGKREDSIFGVLPVLVAGLASGGTLGPVEDEGLENDKKSGGESKLMIDFILLRRLVLLVAETLSSSSLATGMTGGEAGRC